MGLSCILHHHREWVPLESHHVWPLGDGGPNIPENRINVCANGHYSIHAYLDLLIKNGGDPSWATAKHFSSDVRYFAHKGYAQIVAHNVVR